MGSFDDALDEAENMTNEQLSNQLSAIVHVDKKKLEALFPSKLDKQKLFGLIKIVRSASDDNKKKAEIISSIGDYAGMILNLAKMFI